MLTSTGQHKRIFFSLLVSLLVPLFGSAENLQAQEKDPNQVTETMTLKQSEAVGDIESLKKRFGTVQERYQIGPEMGSEMDMRKQSLETVKDVVKSQMPAGQEIGQSQKLLIPPGFSSADPASSPQQVLRSSARTLEKLAADLEGAKIYEQADELRKTAARYWLQARSMN